MTVKELRDWLNRADDAWIVVLSADEDGNKFSPLEEATEGYYSADNTWSGEFQDTPYATDANAVCLWPVH